MFTEDWLGEKFHAPVRMKEIQINFNQSSALGEHLQLDGALNEDGSFYVEGQLGSNGKNAFQAQGTCEEIQPSEIK